MGEVTWREGKIAALLATQLFERKYLVVVPNCGWAGNECDLLVVTENLRIIDVEIKISRDDLKADAKKRKWYHGWDRTVDGPWHGEQCTRRRMWPQKVWKHYYALPASIWDDKLLPTLGSESSGVILLTQDAKGKLAYTVRRPAKPCKTAQKLCAEHVAHIARLASLRMWAALQAR